MLCREKTASTTDGMRITGEGGMKDIGAEMTGRSCQHTWLIIWSCAAREPIIIWPPNFVFTDEIVVAVGLQHSEKTFQKVNISLFMLGIPII